MMTYIFTKDYHLDYLWYKTIKRNLIPNKYLAQLIPRFISIKVNKSIILQLHILGDYVYRVEQ